MNTIRRYGNPAEAGFAQSLLVAAGIDAVLADEFAATLGPQFVPWGMRLQVREEDVGRALEVLDGQGGLDGRSEQDCLESADGEQDATAPMEHEAPARSRDEGERPDITCPKCGAEWALTQQELARPSFTCTDCGTIIPRVEVEAPMERKGIFDWRGFLPRSESKWVFVLVMVAYARVLQGIVSDIVTPLTGPSESLTHVVGWDKVFYHEANSVLFTPIWETLLLIAIIELLQRLGAPVLLQILISTAALGAVDGMYFWPHGVIVTPFFVLCGISYLYWRTKSWRSATGIVIVIHALSNCIPGTWLVFTQLERDLTSMKATGYAANWDHADKLYAQGGVYLANHSYQEAIVTMRQAINLYEYDPRYHVRLAIALHRAGRLAEAESEAREAITLDEKDWAAWEDLAIVLNDEKRFPAALDAAHRALDAAPPYVRSGIVAWIKEIGKAVTATSQ